MQSLREVVLSIRDRDFKSAVLVWVDRTGPYVEEDRQDEVEDYFEFSALDVTDTGLGEAARRVKNAEPVSTLSFPGGNVSFSADLLSVDHGLVEERLGRYDVDNTCSVETLKSLALNDGPAINSWQSLVEAARDRFPRLQVPDSVYGNAALAREPFEAAIRDRVLELLSLLNEYMRGRAEDGSEGPVSRNVIDNHFVGERAAFTGESPGNQDAFRTEMTFRDPDHPHGDLFCHWHGKISRRFFRMHFEWPVPAGQRMLKVLYIGPKITKS